MTDDISKVNSKMNVSIAFNSTCIKYNPLLKVCYGKLVDTIESIGHNIVKFQPTDDVDVTSTSSKNRFELTVIIGTV